MNKISTSQSGKSQSQQDSFSFANFYHRNSLSFGKEINNSTFLVTSKNSQKTKIPFNNNIYIKFDKKKEVESSRKEEHH